MPPPCVCPPAVLSIHSYGLGATVWDRRLGAFVLDESAKLHAHAEGGHSDQSGRVLVCHCVGPSGRRTIGLEQIGVLDDELGLCA